MTRLVGVRAVCDGCSASAAAVFCVSHRNVLCPPCDLAQHNNHATASHQRVDLSSAVTALPFCEHCDDAPATTYCESESSTLCGKCDKIVHEAVEIPHWRSPIERTLRSRAVEFRVNSRPRQNGRLRASQQIGRTNPPHQRSLSPEQRENGKDSPKLKHQNPRPDSLESTESPTCQWPIPQHSTVSPLPMCSPVSSVQSTQPLPVHPQQLQLPQQIQVAVQTPLSAPPVVPRPRQSQTQQRRRPRPLAKRKRDMQRLSQQLQNFRPLDTPFSRVDALPSDDFFVYQNTIRPPQPNAYGMHSDLPQQPQPQPQPLQEPLLMETDSNYLDIDMLSYDGLTLSGEATAIEGGNGSGKSASVSGSIAESGVSSRRKTPDIDMMPHETRVPQNTPTQAALTEVASAVAAAGEQYLLNSVSSASGSSGERESPPVDMTCAPDPAGLVAAATAAAASAVAYASVIVDLGVQGLKPAPAALAIDATAEALSGRMRQPRLSRRLSEPAIPSARDMAKVDAAREAISDEAMRRLEIECRRTKQEDLMRVDSGEREREGNTDQLVAQMSDGEDVLRSGEEMGYLEISREDFAGEFDSIDLSQFEQNGSGGLGFGMGSFDRH